MITTYIPNIYTTHPLTRWTRTEFLSFFLSFFLSSLLCPFLSHSSWWRLHFPGQRTGDVQGLPTCALTTSTPLEMQRVGNKVKQITFGNNHTVEYPGNYWGCRESRLPLSLQPAQYLLGFVSAWRSRVGTCKEGTSNSLTAPPKFGMYSAYMAYAGICM